MRTQGRIGHSVRSLGEELQSLTLFDRQLWGHWKRYFPEDAAGARHYRALRAAKRNAPECGHWATKPSPKYGNDAEAVAGQAARDCTAMQR
jgi:hypothetical protein